MGEHRDDGRRVLGRERAEESLVCLGVGELGRRNVGRGQDVGKPGSDGCHRDPVTPQGHLDCSRHPDQGAFWRCRRACARRAAAKNGRNTMKIARPKPRDAAGARACVSRSADSTLTSWTLRHTSRFDRLRYWPPGCVGDVSRHSAVVPSERLPRGWVRSGCHEIVIGRGSTGIPMGLVVEAVSSLGFPVAGGQRIATGPGGAPAVPVNGSGGAEMNAS